MYLSHTIQIHKASRAMHVFMHNNIVFYKLTTFVVFDTQHVHRQNVSTIELDQHVSLYMHNAPYLLNLFYINACTVFCINISVCLMPDTG